MSDNTNGVGGLLRAEAENVKMSVLGASPNFSLIDIMKPQVDRANRKITFHIRFKYNNMLVVYTIENIFSGTITQEVVNQQLTILKQVTSLLSHNLVLLLEQKEEDSKYYSILYGSSRAFHFIITLKFTSTKTIDYTINIRKGVAGQGAGIIYSLNTKYGGGNLILNNTIVKTNNTGLSKTDRVTIKTVQLMNRMTMLNLTKNPRVQQMVNFLTYLYTVLNYYSFMDKNFIGTMMLNTRILFTANGLDPQKSIFTMNRGTVNVTITVPQLIAIYQNMKGNTPIEKIKGTSLIVYTNRIQS